ncbi:MAG: hypothetical protein HKP52_00530 [Desulfofustis sp.]|nr:hypothetical protein [Desulfofustis sp.]
MPQYQSTLDFVAGDLTLVMDTPSILGITPEELKDYRPAHPKYFHKTPKYRYGGACYAQLPGEVPEQVSKHFDTSGTKLYCAMGVSGSPEVLRSMINIVRDLDLRALIVTTTILDEGNNDSSGQVLIQPHVPAHLVNPMADFAITHGGAGTVQTAIHSGTPIVGIPMHQEQAGNVARVRKRGAGLMLWKSELTRNNLAASLETLISNDSYRENMQQLKSEQDQIDGAAVAAREIVNFLSASHD